MIEFRVQALAETTSTNERVKSAIEAGEPEGLVVRSLVQTGGYGRQGRAWASPEGGLYMSLLLRPEVPAAQLPTLSLVCGLAVQRALRSLVHSDRAEGIKVKWPNDVLCETGKLCGISLESHAGAVCVGCGVNVFPPQEDLNVGGKNTPAYLAELDPGLAEGSWEDCLARLDDVADAILVQFAPVYDQWCREGLSPFVDELNRCESLMGSRVCMVDISGEPLAQGVAERVDEYGRLVLRCDDGSEKAVASGEAHISVPAC